MPARNASQSQIEKNKKNQKMRIKVKKAARRSGKITKQEGKVSQSESKTKVPLKRSQKRTATINKSRY